MPPRQSTTHSGNTLWASGATIAEAYEQREFSRAIREIMALADRANEYIAEQAPWALAKQDGKAQQVQDICSLGLNLFRLLMIYLKPVVPTLATHSEAFLNDTLVLVR